MTFVSVDFQKCPWTPDGIRPVRFNSLDLRHAALAVGRNWRQRARTTTNHHHIQARVHDILSTVEFPGGAPARVSATYRAISSSERATRSFSLGNAFCALIARKELGVEWLVDLEQLTPHHQVRRRAGRKRADFLGRTPSGRWYVFEAKGRSYPLRPEWLDEWKKQARTVRRVNGRKPAGCLVSATYAEDDDTLHAVWRDPPPNAGQNLKFDELVFCGAYYSPVLHLIEAAHRHENLDGHRLAYLADAFMSVGVHRQVLAALAERRPAALWRFAEGLRDPQDSTQGEGQSYRVFPDGLIIRLHSERSDNRVLMDV